MDAPASIVGIDYAAAESRTAAVLVAHGGLHPWQEYNEGPSAWGSNHAIFYPDSCRMEIREFDPMMSSEQPMTQVCDECSRRAYACRRVQDVGGRLQEVPDKQREGASWVCPSCYPILRQATVDAKN